jgi:hypothetical protein
MNGVLSAAAATDLPVNLSFDGHMLHPISTAPSGCIQNLRYSSSLCSFHSLIAS